MDISNILQNWYLENKRDLPWRKTKNPYYIWLSEVILQQTRVNQGMKYYNRFITEFPDVKSLADANEDKVLKLWQGLGYYNRAQNLIVAANQIVNNYNSKIPEEFIDLLKIKGIGNYTAAAISSIAYNKAKAVVDGNVIRFITRYTGIIENIKLNSTIKQVNNYAEKIIDHKNPGIHNQAIMEYGALVCTPKNVKCNICNFNNTCSAYTNGIVNEIPYKSSTIKQKNRYFHYLIFVKDNCIHITKRTKKDIWKNLYEFPLIEKKEKVNFNKLSDTKQFKLYTKNIPYTFIDEIIVKQHNLSHQKIYTSFFIFNIEDEIADQFPELIKIQVDELIKYPIPKLIDNFFSESNHSLLH